jgi:hypothetical protein
MPSWKKVITSGSAAALQSLTVTNGITGSLFGTASFATTASFLNNTTNAFIQNGNSFGTTALLGTNDNNSLALETSGSTRMFISSSGLVGIGITAPTTPLHVSGTIHVQTSNGSTFYGQDSGGSYARTFGVEVYDFRDAAGFTKVKINTSTGLVGIGTTAPNAKLDVSGSAIISGSFTVTPGTVREFQVNSTGVDIGNLITDTHTVTGSLSVSGSVSILSSILQYSNNAAITSGSTANIASFSTSSFTAGFFDYVATSGTNARAGSVFTVWNGNNVEYAETSTNDIGSTNNLILSASVSAGAIRLQGTSLSGSWSVKTLTRMI